ncbi:hypothetical protein ALC53_00034 [Atta colombica]|uniref:Uncharacterized protein n=1 Tax=Atta colombica TaxID=520822 RepID=A0A151K1L6_9HYME|nr:hypothetical protein ALC53_00034 [Atta colombica]
MAYDSSTYTQNRCNNRNLLASIEEIGYFTFSNNSDVSYEDFCDLCHKYWQQKYRFLVIDKNSALIGRRYTKGFNNFAIP